ncbi:MAG: ABC transporter permease [Coriobacteriales bacterium]
MYAKIALGNIRRSFRDYSVYFMTLAFAACLLYSFTASGDYLLALDLTDRQRGVYESAGNVMQAFSVFSVIVFAFLVVYASRFILRRRSGEFAIYGLLGMPASSIARILAYEGFIVGIVALAIGVLVGVILSPFTGFVATFVFDVPWALVFSFSPDALAWTAGCFAAIMIIATLLGIRDVNRRPLIELLRADSMPEAPKGIRRLSMGLQLAMAVVLLCFVWGSCILNPIFFIVWILPLGVVAVFATGVVFRWLAVVWPRRARHNEHRYFSGLHYFVIRQVESRVTASSNAVACTCVLMAVAICMMVAGLAFSVGMRGSDGILDAANMAPIGYVGIFYGITFLVAAAAVLALQQLADAVDSAQRFELLGKLGCDHKLMRRAVRTQVGVYFVSPFVFALVHCIFGLALVGFLALMLGSSSFALIVGAVIGTCAVLFAAYYALTCHECERVLL